MSAAETVDLPERARSRLGAALAAPVRGLALCFLPDRAVPRAVESGRYAGLLLVATAAALLSALTIADRVDVSGRVLQGESGSSDSGNSGSSGSGDPAAQADVNDRAMSDREYDEAIDKARAVEKVTRGLRAGALPLELFGLALALYGISRYVGGRPTLRRAMALAACAALPGAIRSILETIAARQHPLLAPAQASALTPSWHRLDPFTLWSAVLILLGLPALAGLSRRRSLVTVAVCLALWMVLTQIVLHGPETATGVPT